MKFREYLNLNESKNQEEEAMINEATKGVKNTRNHVLIKDYLKTILNDHKDISKLKFTINGDEKSLEEIQSDEVLMNKKLTGSMKSIFEGHIWYCLGVSKK